MAEVKTQSGKFIAQDSEYVVNAAKDGVDIKLQFEPGKGVDAKKFGMVQTANTLVKGKPSAINPTVKDRSIKSGEKGEGTHIDQYPGVNNPLYAVNQQPAGDKTLGGGKVGAGVGQHGWHYVDDTKAIQSQNAILIDTPSYAGADSQKFESTCTCFEGRQKGQYYGSVSWGWESDGAGGVKKLPLTLVSEGTPSATFLKAAEIWNSGKSGGQDNLGLPIPPNLEGAGDFPATSKSGTGIG